MLALPAGQWCCSPNGLGQCMHCQCIQTVTASALLFRAKFSTNAESNACPILSIDCWPAHVHGNCVVSHKCRAELLHEVCAEGLQQGSSLKHGCSLGGEGRGCRRGGV